MPASNMASPIALDPNPNTGKQVIMSPFSGPAGSPFDNDQTGNHSTGALNTGIGFGLTPIFDTSTNPNALRDAGFFDDEVPGISLPDGTASTIASLTCIGGGKSLAAVNGYSAIDPYVAQPLLAFGAYDHFPVNYDDGVPGIDRDAGLGPAFTGHAMLMVTASGGDIAPGAEIETDYLNAGDFDVNDGNSAFGSDVNESPAVT